MKPRPYKEIRKTLIDALANPAAVRPNAPARPRNLDTRLPAADAKKLRALGPPNEKNWQKICDHHEAIVESIRAELAKIDKETDWHELLSPARRAVILAHDLECEVNNGGFDQYYLNSSGDGAHAAPEALRMLGLPQIAAMVEKANGVFKGGPSPDREARLAAMDNLPDTARDAWSKLDDQFFGLDLPYGGLAGAEIRLVFKHESEFFKTDP